MKQKSFDDIVDKIHNIHFGQKFDLVIGIANGGIVPAYLVAHSLNLPLDIIWINFRNDDQVTKYESPILIKPVSFDYKGKAILLVDDRVQSGATVNFAKSLLGSAKLTKTFAVNGKADYSLFDEECFGEPWNI